VYDYLIVGAGSAGCVLAARLTEDPACRVLLLEAGPPDRKLEIKIPAAFNKLFKTRYDWAYETVPQQHLDGRPRFWPRGKTLGGSSSLNAMMYVRGNRVDYDTWAALGNDGWGYDDVLPYFRRSENFERGPTAERGAGGPLNVAELRDLNPASEAFLQAAQEVGIPRNDDINGAVQDGVDATQVTQKRGRRWSAADAYLRPARKRGNLTVETGALAQRVRFDGRRAVGVDYVVGEQARRADATREVIVAGGAINSPQLLMLSGVGPADQLRAHGIPLVHELPGVGQHLLDHLAVVSIVACNEPVTLAAAQSVRNVGRFLLSGRGMLTSNVAEAAAFVRSRDALPAPDLELVFAPVTFLDHGLEAPTDHGLTIGAVALQPRSVGALTLASADPSSPPRIDPNYLSDDGGEDLRVLVEGMHRAREIFAAPAFTRYVGAPTYPAPSPADDEEAAQHVRRYAESLYHPVGTCAMGNGPDAVVDASLRVHGVEQLRVVDASVMPTIPRGHTHASTVMIAEKASDLLKEGR
jgi:choline dehydrogenase-like flavoprotein